MKAEIKCNGCSKDMPKVGLDVNTQRPTWFGMYQNDIMIEFICIECWDKGVRWKNNRS